MSQNFGIMDQGYFVSRTEILNWINKILRLNITHIEQLGTGAVYCQLLDSLYPGRVQLNKINWKAKLPYEFIQNYKLLQASFERLAIMKKIDVEKLSRCKYQDNLQMIQWLKRYIELEGGSQNDYDPQSRRGKIEIDLCIIQKKSIANKQNNKSNSSMNYFSKLPSQVYNKQINRTQRTLTSSQTQNCLGIKKSCQKININTRKSSAQLVPLSNKQIDDLNKIDKIKRILNDREESLQIQKIKQLLNTQYIDEVEQPEFI